MPITQTRRGDQLRTAINLPAKWNRESGIWFTFRVSFGSSVH